MMHNRKMEHCQPCPLSSATAGTCRECPLAKVRDEGAESRSTIVSYVQVGLWDAANVKSLTAYDLSVMGKKEKRKKKEEFVAVFQVEHKAQQRNPL